MSEATYNFILGIAGVVLLVLGSVLWWFIRDHMRAREKREDLLEKRLSSGSETMQRIAAQLDNIQTRQVAQAAEFVRVDTFEEYCTKQDKVIYTVQEQMREQGQILAGMARRIDTGIETMTNLLARIVTIPTDPGDK